MKRSRASVDESPWLLEVNNRSVASGTFTPDRAEALGAGRLLTEGYITEARDLRALCAVRLDPGVTLIRAAVATARALEAEQERRHRAERNCGLLHYVVCDPLAARLPRDAPVPDAGSFPALLRALFAATDGRHPQGGVHAAALTDGSRLLIQVEDVGRHNAVEKVLGTAFLDGIDLSRLGLLVSARISGQMALAAARAGIAWLASRSVPTTLAMRVARAARLPLVERAAGKDAGVLAPDAPETDA